jgi:uncharacterized protein
MTKTTKPYETMLKEEVLAIAQRLGLTNLSRLRKDEIIDLITKATAKKEKGASLAKPRVKKPSSVPTKKPVSKTPQAKPISKTPQAKPSSKVAPANTTARSRSTAIPRSPAASSVKTPAPRHAPDPLRPPPMGPVSAQTNAMISKYQVTAPYRFNELQGLDESLPELPESYGDNRIVLLPRDISWLFAYWDLTEEYKEAARSAGGSVLALRLYDVTGVDFDGTNAHAMYEHECAEWARSWYIPTPTPDRDFIVEIGYRGTDQWFPLARSNKVSVPSDQPSTWIKDDFISIRFEEDLREVRNRLPQENEQRVEAHAPMSAASTPDQTILDDGQLRIIVGGARLSPSGMPGFPLFSSMEQGRLPLTLPSSVVPGSPSFAPGSPSFAPGSPSFAPGSPSFAPGSPSFAPGSPFFLPGSFGFMPGSPGFTRPRVPLEILGQTLPHPTLDAAPAGSTISAEYAEAPSPEAPLLLTNMEMVIAGRSMPGTDLRIAGRPIPLGPDGCFSLRITVPEGLRELPIEARTPQSTETRRITLRLGRESE